MFRYQDIQGRPGVFRGLTGMDTTAFEALLQDFDAAHRAARAASTRTRRDGQPRRRAPGGGRRHALDLRDRLLMALAWLRVYPTCELLGYFFGLNHGNANRNVADVLAGLEGLGHFPFDRPDRDPDRAPLDSAAAVMDAFPEVRLVVDTKEQRIRRPKGDYAAQKPYDSMKKKAHTLKAQVAVRPTGGSSRSARRSPAGRCMTRRCSRRAGCWTGCRRVRGRWRTRRTIASGMNTRQSRSSRPDRRGHPLTVHERVANRFIARYRIVVEHAIAQLNRYTVLRQCTGGRGRATRGWSAWWPIWSTGGSRSCR